MPEWLLKSDEYIPAKSKDTFINKSILSLLRLLSRFCFKSKNTKGLFKINAVFKVISALLIVTLLSLSRSMMFIASIIILLLFVLSTLEAYEIKSILSVSVTAVLFSLIVLIPSMLMGNVSNSIKIVFKVFASVTVVNLLSYTTEWNDITGALKIFFIPDIFILVLDITLKYIMVLGNFSLDMLYALKLRSVGKSIGKHYSVFGIMGTMFIKSKEMADEMYGAMECRGFTGEYTIFKKFQFHFIDFLFILINVALVIIYFYFGRL